MGISIVIIIFVTITYIGIVVYQRLRYIGLNEMPRDIVSRIIVRSLNMHMYIHKMSCYEYI